jgi:hypothetical protein
MIKRLKKLTREEIERLQYLAAYQPCITKEIDSVLKAKNWVVIEGDDGTSISATAYPKGENVLYKENGSINDFWRLEDPDDAAARAEAEIDTVILPW